MEGTVKFFNEAKGFGFIINSDGKSQHFVHVSGLVDQIKEGDTVTYELEDDQRGKGPKAVDVKVIGSAAMAA